MKKWFEFPINTQLPQGHLVQSQVIPEGRTLLIGVNGVGKSSLLYAHKVSLLGDKDKKASFCDQLRLESFLDLRVADISKKLVSYLAHFEREDLLQKNINDLSGGENQIVKIALCFSKEASGYFFDEPYQYLNEKMSHKLSQLFSQCQKNLFVIDHSGLFNLKGYTFELTHHEKNYRLESR